MYMGVVFGLLTLLLIAVAASIVGGISFSAVSIISGATTFVLVCIIVNYAFGYIFSVKTQLQSAVITGLILSFIFSPPTEVRDYIVIAIVGSLAMVSKYLLAWRGRHIFNPAAVAAVVISLAGISAASWWVATPALLVPVLLFGTFTLYRTHRLTMGYIYVAVALSVSLLVTSVDGPLTSEIVWMIIASYPILFLAFFMLSEPLTQAPRNWQRISIAIGIAVVASSQLSILNLFITPEIALIVGNLGAFMYGQKRGVKLRYVSKKEYGNNQVAYYFKPLHPLVFKAGQYIELSMAHSPTDLRGMRRMFSVASGEKDEVIRIITRHSVPSSGFKIALANLKKNDVVAATGVYGDFVLPPDNTRKLLFLAGGIGVTPFLSHISSLSNACDITLLYFIRDKMDSIDEETLIQAKKYGITTFFVRDQSIEEAVSQYVLDIDQRTAYISGSPRFVDAAKSVVKKKSKKIVTDYFSGY